MSTFQKKINVKKNIVWGILDVKGKGLTSELEKLLEQGKSITGTMHFSIDRVHSGYDGVSKEFSFEVVSIDDLEVFKDS